jgi:hypothetical protein
MSMMSGYLRFLFVTTALLFSATVSLVDDYRTCFMFMRTSSLTYVTTRSLAIKAANFPLFMFLLHGLPRSSDCNDSSTIIYRVDQ